MKLRLIIITAILLLNFTEVDGQAYPDPKNHACLKCHSSQTFSFINEMTGKDQKRLMNPYYILDTITIRQGVHNPFDCTDCHSYEYSTYPHNGNLKLEPLASCLDCHGGDETYASYQFEKIDEEFKKSVHYNVYGDEFTCAKCHDQHTYKPVARNSNNILEIVESSNSMCLSCHNDMKNYQLVSGKEKPELVQVHQWLPNQELHFRHVRCIECHTEVVDGLNVSHNIQGKAKAVKKCVECHSANSRLKASLYKYQNLQKRSDGGDELANMPSYIIGTHQNPILKLISIILFLGVVAGIVVHSVFRILKK